MSPSEFELIDWIRTRGAAAAASEGPHRIETGIGDDCAVVRTGSGDRLLLACDALIEGVHFDRTLCTDEQIGWKALGCNLSDVAAMGGRPTLALIALALPSEGADETVRGIFQGLDRLASRFGVQVVGGDLSRSPGGISVAVTVVGTIGEEVALRSQAAPGEAVLVTGALGGSGSGHHLDFMPRVEAGERLTREHGVRAMIDVSDGLAQDLGHILAASQVGGVLEAGRIPVSDAARRAAGTSGRSALDHALNDGEDFELLFTAAPSAVPGIVADTGLGVPVTRIGSIRAGSGLEVVGAGGNVLAPGGRGHDHFRA